MNRFSFTGRHALCVWVAAVLLGCAAPAKKPPPVTPPTAFDPALENILKTRALKSEKAGDLPKALRFWQSLAFYSPENQMAVSRADALKKDIAEKADRHFKRGVTYFYHDATRDATREFLKTLYYDPEHQKTLAYLKDKIHPQVHVLHRVKRGETIEGLAQKFYKDPQKSYLIAYYNDLDQAGQLEVDQTLELPRIEIMVAEPVIAAKVKQEPEKPKIGATEKKAPEKPAPKVLKEPAPAPDTPKVVGEALPQKEASETPAATVSKEPAPPPAAVETPAVSEPEPEPETSPETISETDTKVLAKINRSYQRKTTNKKQLMRKAGKQYKEGSYYASISIAEGFLEQDPENEWAQNMVNASYYQIGKQMDTQNNPSEAIRFYGRVDPDYKDVRVLKVGIEAKLADGHYLEGIKHFLKEDIKLAIAQWEMAVALNPDHQKARTDMQHAKKILEKVEKID